MPQDSQNVLMYTCGVTVYDDCHIGHARSLYTFEIVKRILEYANFKVRWVRNITDIDDKIIEKSRALYGSGKEFKKVAQSYIESYYQDLQSFSLDKAPLEPLATENIGQMLGIIKILHQKGFAYSTSQGVYFRVRKFLSYGDLSGQDINSLRGGVRIEPDPNKEDALDFSLWKKSGEDEPSWDSPWMEGRPGWHIECSAMSYKFLGPTLDIHGGGRDLVFPHHENERAQSEAFTGETFSRYWLHHGLIFVEGKKMSKSLGNFITMKDYLKKADPEELKLLMLSVHYRSPLDFSWKSLEHFRNLKEDFVKINYYLWDVPLLEKVKFKYLGDFRERFKKAILDDFDTPSGLSITIELSKNILQFLYKHRDFKSDFLIEAKFLWREFLQVLGLFKGFSIPRELKNFVEEKLKERQRLRRNKEFAKADAVRRFLLEKNIFVEDLKDKSLWYLKERNPLL